MLFRERFGSASVTLLARRIGRFTVLLKFADKRTRPVMGKVIAAIRAQPQPARRLITFDCGTEFVSWPHLQAEIGANSWFCDPSAPWQKGMVENTNGRARLWLLWERNIGQLSDHDIRDRLNATPCKCLGWKAPAEMFRAKMLEKGT